MKLIDVRTLSGAYDLPCDQAIVEKQGRRILLTEGYGGGDVQGKTYRWQHGLAIGLLPGDTFESLDKPANEDYTSYLQIALAGGDPDRPDLLWSHYVIDNAGSAVMDAAEVL